MKITAVKRAGLLASYSCGGFVKLESQATIFILPIFCGMSSFMSLKMKVQTPSQYLKMCRLPAKTRRRQSRENTIHKWMEIMITGCNVSYHEMSARKHSKRGINTKEQLAEILCSGEMRLEMPVLAEGHVLNLD